MFSGKKYIIEAWFLLILYKFIRFIHFIQKQFTEWRVYLIVRIPMKYQEIIGSDIPFWNVQQLPTYRKRLLPKCHQMRNKNMCILLRLLLVRNVRIDFMHCFSSFLANLRLWQNFTLIMHACIEITMQIITLYTLRIYKIQCSNNYELKTITIFTHIFHK